MGLELLGFQSLLFIFLSVHYVSSMDFDEDYVLKSITCDCELYIERTIWNMECDSNNFDLKHSSKFITSRIRGTLNDEIPIVFQDILNSTSLSDSEFYICDSEWRYFVLRDRSMLSSNCMKRKNLKKIISTLDESSLIKLHVTHIKTPSFALNILPNCSQLRYIVITGNLISNMSFFPIHSNNTIKSLNLKDNSIQIIAEGLLTELHDLKSLNLSHNLLKSIHKKLFDGMRSLNNLDLSRNVIEYISADTLWDLVVLEYISLSDNKLQSIDGNIFKLNKYLQTIDISNNSFKTLPSNLFHDMQNLKIVSCSKCSLTHLDKDIFKNSSNVARFVVKDNYIRSLHPDIFKNVNYLAFLDLRHNKLLQFNGSLFSNHPYLKYVNISENKITELNPDVFRGARNVRYLDFSLNRITSKVTDDYFKNFTDIENLELHHNMIRSVEFGIAGTVRIRKINLSHNFITNVNVRWKQLVLLEIFNLNNNLLTSIDLPPCIPNMKQTLTFYFQHNKISKIDMKALIFDENRVKTDRTLTCFVNGLARNYVDLTNNPLHCDCKMYPFYNYIRGISPRRYQIEIFIDRENLTCKTPDFLTNNTLVYLPEDILSCPLKHDCPEPCYCGIRDMDDSIFMNCSARALQEVPETGPYGTTVLYFNRNLLKSIKSLNNDNWFDLIEIHLDYNFLSTLDDWKFPASLRYLSVKNNQLKTLPDILMHFISNQTNFQLYFGNNDFNCDCDRKLFQRFLRDNVLFIKDNDNILCNLTNSNNTFELLPLTTVFDSVLCSKNIISNIKQIRIIIVLCTFFSVLILVILFYFRQRQLIISYFYVHWTSVYNFFYADFVDEDAIFDAFVAYSSNDREIVMKLLEELENNPPYFNLCIHERNWLPGRFITDNITDSVENSKRTIIILSSTFISSPWFNVELRAAVCRMTQDTVNRLIVILCNKAVSLESIDPELKHIVSKRTYLEWGERWFWEKLRYALPRKSITDTKLENQLRRSISSEALIPCNTDDDNILELI